MMKTLFGIAAVFVICCSISVADQKDDTFRRDINRMKPAQASYSSATQVKLNLKLNRSVFNSYTSNDRLTVASFSAYTSAASNHANLSNLDYASAGHTGFLPDSGGSAGKSMCWKTDTTLGYCSSIVAVDGSCTCN